MLAYLRLLRCSNAVHISSRQKFLITYHTICINIIQLNDKKSVGTSNYCQRARHQKADSFKKKNLFYKILDEQAIAGATKKVAAEKLKEERKGEKSKRSRTAVPKKEEKSSTRAEKR